MKIEIFLQHNVYMTCKESLNKHSIVHTNKINITLRMVMRVIQSMERCLDVVTM